MTIDTAKKVNKRSLPAEVKKAVAASKAKSAEDIVVLDLRGLAAFTDFFLIVNGNSLRQNQAISDHIESELRRQGIRPLGIEGKSPGDWILMDYGALVVHVFSRDKRSYFALEKLWGDAPRALY